MQDMRKMFWLLILLFIGLNDISAQTKKLRWSDELCDFEGTYNAKIYSVEQIKNTKKLIGDEFGVDTSSATVWKFEEIDSLNFAPIEAEYQRKSAELKNLNIVKTPYWEKRRQQKLKEIVQYYLLTKATMMSYKQPLSLRNYTFANACQTKYVDPLITGGDSLLRTWEQVNIDTRKNNGDPDRIKRIFDEQRKSTDALKFARVEVTTFGWWNCANAFIDNGDDYSKLEENFKKLFTRVRIIKCDEP